MKKCQSAKKKKKKEEIEIRQRWPQERLGKSLACLNGEVGAGLPQQTCVDPREAPFATFSCGICKSNSCLVLPASISAIWGQSGVIQRFPGVSGRGIKALESKHGLHHTVVYCIYCWDSEVCLKVLLRVGLIRSVRCEGGVTCHCSICGFTTDLQSHLWLLLWSFGHDKTNEKPQDEPAVEFHIHLCFL